MPSSAEVSKLLSWMAIAGADPGSCDVAEDVLGDLGVRQAIKAMPKNATL